MKRKIENYLNFAKKLSKIQELSNEDYVCIYEE